MKKLYIGNLSPSTSEVTISELFEKFGPVISCRLVKDPLTQRSRGFALVELESHPRAAEAIQELDQRRVDGSAITVNESMPKNGANTVRKRPS